MNIISHIAYEVANTKREVIVVKNFDYSQAKILKKYKHCLIFTKEDFEAGADVFPIDIYMMQKNYHVIEGKDLLQDIKVNKKDLRHHLEYNLRSNRIYLKSQLLSLGAKKLVKSIHDTIYPNIIVAHEVFDLDRSILDTLQSYKEHEPAVLIQETDKAMTKIIKAIN